ncbi:hypothetical protein DFP94_103293 [Fontibacillus phaseoli]|uniref:Uncharacterized protein n=1 Tax=Fontibacillus phaseoli TaxID=1416533 RepID=A0A369BG96_9BACL|nr:hypothetical protein [Fontibacillus phaseoli]RCX20562.1 hypothetical protein DFP94_103293 [Fontibacillus phaseoli]
MPDYPKTEGDQAYERYIIQREYRAENDIPDNDLLPHDTVITQGLSEPADNQDKETELQAENDALPDVPDADEIQPGSPVDQAAPDPDAMHGTDLLNGFDGDESQ